MFLKKGGGISRIGVMKKDRGGWYVFRHYNPAIKEHLLFCNHLPDLEDFSIATTTNNSFKVTSMEISSQKKSLWCG